MTGWSAATVALIVTARLQATALRHASATAVGGASGSQTVEEETMDLQTRLHFSGVFILVVGLCTAAAIYLTADEVATGEVRYEMINGTVYAIPLLETKTYRHNLELYGGKASVLFAEFSDWFEGLWRGRTLAYTVGAISVVASIGIFFLASLVGPPPEPDLRSEEGREDRDRQGS